MLWNVFVYFFFPLSIGMFTKPCQFWTLDGPSRGLWACFDRAEAEQFTLAWLFLAYRIHFLLARPLPPHCPLYCTHICPHLDFEHIANPSWIPKFMFKTMFYTSARTAVRFRSLYSQDKLLTGSPILRKNPLKFHKIAGKTEWTKGLWK